MNVVKKTVATVDRAQQRTGWLGFPLAVLKKFGDDKAGQLAALIAYYGFFSLFPLLLVFITILSFVLANNPELQSQILTSALKQFPVIGDNIAQNINTMPARGAALAVGLVGSIWSGLGGVKAAQNAMDHMWDVPVKRQPNFIKALLKAALMLVTLGVFLLLAGFLGGVAAGSNTDSFLIKAAGVAGSLLLNVAVFWIAFKVLTVEDVSWRDVAPGAVIAAVLWTALQTLGGYIIGHRLDSTTETYGFFGVVIALLWWIYLGAQITLLSAEINVVRVRRLWPRGLDAETRTDADERALREMAKVEERRDDQKVDVRFTDEAPDPGSNDEPAR